MRRISILPLLLLSLLALPACKDKAGPGRVLTSLTITPAAPSVADGATVQLSATGRDQNAQQFNALPAGTTLTWRSADPAIASVSGAGLVTGERPGVTRITASAGGVSASTEVTVTPVATTLAMMGGDGQEGVEGGELVDSLAVRVIDRHGDPVAGVSVEFVVTGGGGSISPAKVPSDAAGHARSAWTIGAATNTAEARSSGLTGSPVGFTAQAAPLNRPPIARDDTATTVIDTPVVIDVLANDEDPDGDPLAVESVTTPGTGAAAINPDGTVTYTPDTGFTGTDSFGYTIGDGRGGTASATVTVIVTATTTDVGHSVPGMRQLVYHEGRFYHVFFENSSGEWDVYLRTSDDAVSWTAKVPVSDAAPGSNQWNASVAVWGFGAATQVAVGYVSFETANPQLRVAVSSDGGQSFTPSVAVSNHTDNSQLQGSIVVGADGALYAAWVRMTGSNFWTHTWFSRSTDGGTSWGAPQVVFNNGRPFNNEVHLAAGAAGEVWVVTAADEGFRKNLILNRSTNGGESWTQSHVTSHPSGGLAEFPTLLRATDGTLYLAWQDRPTAADSWRVRLARSTDGGASWSAPVQVSDDVPLGPGQGNFRIRPALAIGPAATLYVAWTDERLGAAGALEGRNYDVYLSRSTDGGATWSADERVNDMPEVLLQRLPAVAAGPGGALVVWEDGRSGPRRLLHRMVP